MDMVLERFQKTAQGIFSYLRDENGNQIAVTATHAYEQPSGQWDAATLPGRYLCQWGQHQLMIGPPFDTYEITGVPNHSKILFHKGNLPQVDSEGCELLGTAFAQLEGAPDVSNSADAFDAFLMFQSAAPTFWLTVQ